eukprot:3940667-Rhodomonas_salina.2
MSQGLGSRSRDQGLISAQGWRVWMLGSSVWDLKCRVENAGASVEDLRPRLQGQGARVSGLEGLRSKVQGLGSNV